MKTGIPLVTHCCSGNSFSQIPEDLYGFCVKGNESERQLRIMRQMSLAFFKLTDDWFNEHIALPYGLAPIENAIGLCSREYAIAQTISALSKERIASLPNVHLTGPIVVDSPSDADFSRFKPYCYVSLGTSPWNKAEIAARYRDLVGFIPRRFNIVIGLGGLMSEKVLDIRDRRVTAFERAPQIEAIRHCEFVVCHGGCQTVHEALYYAKPLIGIPHHAEISEMVNSVENAGAGVRISPSQVDQRTIDAAVDSVTADATRDKAEMLATALSKTDGLTNTVDLFGRLGAADTT